MILHYNRLNIGHSNERKTISIQNSNTGFKQWVILKIHLNKIF